jgi:hypothetical protein
VGTSTDRIPIVFSHDGYRGEGRRVTVLERLKHQHVEASRQADRLAKMVELAEELGDDGLAELVALLGSEEPRNGHANGHGNNKPGRSRTITSKKKAPRGRDAVRRIVRTRPGIWTLTELRSEMQKRGWYTSASGLEAAAKRLCEVNREGRRLGPGRYIFPADYEPDEFVPGFGKEGAIESEASGEAMISLDVVTG